METRKIITLLNNSSNEEPKFATKKCHRQSNNKRWIQACDTIKFETETIKSSLCYYSDAFILVTGNINRRSIWKFAPFPTCKTVINVFVDNANHIYIAMPMYNLIKYSDNYSDTSGSL